MQTLEGRCSDCSGKLARYGDLCATCYIRCHTDSDDPWRLDAVQVATDMHECVVQLLSLDSVQLWRIVVGGGKKDWMECRRLEANFITLRGVIAATRDCDLVLFSNAIDMMTNFLQCEMRERRRLLVIATIIRVTLILLILCIGLFLL